MRRNAESLLILAGAESGPRRSKPIDMVDVVRAALSEVEEYERVDLGEMADAVLHGPAVSDVAHLVAELLENATQFSPPDTVVRVEGTRAGGGYQLVISDRGVGIRPEQLDELNGVLSAPPVTGLALGRSLGCLVAARLACRGRPAPNTLWSLKAHGSCVPIDATVGCSGGSGVTHGVLLKGGRRRRWVGGSTLTR